LLAKLKQLATDATLRRWLIARVLGRTTSPDPFAPHCPPYLAGIRPPGAEPGAAPAAANDRTLRADVPGGALTLPLPGESVTVAPGDEAALWDRSFADTETLLAAHRFAWVPILGERADPAWVAALWNAWRARYALPDRSWAWHPYTAAERAVNLLRFFGRHGHPAPAAATRECLAAHATAIAARLEYFGPRNTGNHLANNGRGLFALGLGLRMPAFADIGAKILVEEAKRIFSPSGVLREGSSHYHLLYARGYAEAWLWARRHGHGAAAKLESVAARALAVAPHLCLKGGLPLMGDISPDCPPDHLSAFRPDDPATTGWGALLDSDERAAFLALRAQAGIADRAVVAADGWLRFDSGDWNGLWHAAPGGWSPMPGHGHQDTGSFEIHWRDMPLFVDLGRGSYGEDGPAALYRSARVHNGLALDGADPYPPNKPYYDDAFRRREGGPEPSLAGMADGVTLTFGGYGRIGAPVVRRQWSFARNGFAVRDTVEGRGRHRIARRLHTPWPVENADGAAIVRGPSGDFRVRAERTAPVLRPVVRWTAYGEGAQANAIVFETGATLPWSGAVNVEKL
jgi:hypothetical protein